MLLDEREESLHWEALPGTARERGERLGEDLMLVGEGETDASCTPIDGEDPARHPCAIVAKNSTFVFVRFIRSSRNSIASTGGMSDRKLRSR